MRQLTATQSLLTAEVRDQRDAYAVAEVSAVLDTEDVRRAAGP